MRYNWGRESYSLIIRLISENIYFVKYYKSYVLPECGQKKLDVALKLKILLYGQIVEP